MMASPVKALKSSRVEEGRPSTLQPFNASILELHNRQRTKRLNTPLLRQIAQAALAGLANVTRADVVFYFVGAKKMAGINEAHLGHDGPTDVITFDYADHASRITHHDLHGEIFICVDVAIQQAREFKTTWQSELVRYLVHGLLHLCGFDDLEPSARREMKRHENRLVRQLSRRFQLARLGRPGSLVY